MQLPPIATVTVPLLMGAGVGFYAALLALRHWLGCAGGGERLLTSLGRVGARCLGAALLAAVAGAACMGHYLPGEESPEWGRRAAWGVPLGAGAALWRAMRRSMG